MGKLVVVDECLVPRRLTWLHYEGPDPVGFLRNLKMNLRFIFEVSTTRCMQKKLLWDYSGDPIRFYDEWHIKKELGRFTNMWIKLRLIGHVSKGKQDGNFSMEVYGEIRNIFEPSNWFTKYIWIIYNHLFYNSVRERYIKMCRDYIQQFLNWCKEKYNLKTVTTPEGRLEMVDEEMNEIETEEANETGMEKEGEKEQTK